MPMIFREDFCGTAFLCSEWVKTHPERIALGVDIDGPTLAWARKNNLDRMNSGTERIFLYEDDCIKFSQESKEIEVDGEAKTGLKADIICANNYSTCLLQERFDLVRYFKQVKSSLSSKGLFVMVWLPS